MDQTLANEPVSADCGAFRDLLGGALARREVVILLLRHANCGGARDYFIARSESELAAVLKHARPKTSITTFFEANFQCQGTADEELCNRAIELLPTLQAAYEGIDLIRLDGPGCELDATHFLYARQPQEIRRWFDENRGAPVLAGTLEFWHDNSPSMVTAYAADYDGVVRPGAY